MKILFLTLGDRKVASSRARVYSYEPYLKREGWKMVVMHYTPSWQCRKILSMGDENIIEKIINKLYSGCVMLSLFMLAPFFNLVYIQKVYISKFSMKILRILNNKVTFDFDDAVYLYKNITYLLTTASAVIASNDYLKTIAFDYNNQTYKLITPVNVHNKQHLVKENNAVILGWIGSIGTSKYLNPLIPVFKKLTEKFKNLKIIFMGCSKNEGFELFGINVIDWSLEGEKKYLGEINIGIMPLEDDEWSRAKSGYKLLQYMAAAIPCVASPVGVNKEIVKNGVNGFLANTPDEWLDKLSALVVDASLRKKMGQEGLSLAETLYSYEVTSPKLIEILSSVIKRE